MNCVLLVWWGVYVRILVLTYRTDSPVSAVLIIKVVYRSYKELLDFLALKGLVRPHTMRPLLRRASYCHLLV
eukprot:SAG11_NODE_30269_length_302_cov_1.128079_1_plen_71_part_01